MEMHQVRYFLALSEDLNFTRAAERCHVAQPSLTRAIKQLEDEMVRLPWVGRPALAVEKTRSAE
jgi:DNA-binding transcriptional LysR family regulator